MEWVVQLSKVAEGLMTKMYRLNEILDSPDTVSHTFSDSFWDSAVFPNCPKICILVSRKFPEHPNKLQLERVDKLTFDGLSENADAYMQNLEPWVMLLLDLMAFREQALWLILDLSSTVITLLPHQNSLILYAFMDLFCAFVRVNLFSDKIPRKMLLQMYNLLHSMLRSGRDCEFYHRCINAITAGSEFVRSVQSEKKRRSISNSHSIEVLDSEIQTRVKVETNTKSAMQLYVKCSAIILLDSWNESNRFNIVPKVIFLDQLCDLSPYLPRSTLETHMPYALLRSIYRQQYANSLSMTMEFFNPSPRHSPAVSASHSPFVRLNHGGSTPQTNMYDSSYANQHKEPLYDVDGVGHRAEDKQFRTGRRSGPLEYSSSRKVKVGESLTVAGKGRSPLQRLAVSRSGPLSSK